ncbi:MAG: HAD family hydrolase [Erysipelotrichaceae bacterium]|nr:HAD family hydrolase [Erysipelotrichaceae bacterium]
MIKLFISDIDHTLYSSELKCIPQANIDAIKAMMDQGIVICLATSRIYEGLMPTALSLGLDKVRSYGVGFNGAVVKRIDENRVIAAEAFPNEDVQFIKNYAVDNRIGFMLYQDHSYVTNAYTRIAEYNFIDVGADVILTNDFDKYLVDPVHQMSYSDDSVNMYELAEELDERTGHRFNVNVAQPIVIDFSPKGTSKLSGLLHVIEDMDITLEEVAALGDGDNDAPMLKAAGVSGCVGNGSALAKASAKHVLAPCREAGAAEFIRKYVL